jgi:hypothetical protein
MVVVPAPTSSPTLISTSGVAGDGTLAGRRAGTVPPVQPVIAPSTSARPTTDRLTPVVPKLQLDPEILALEKRDHRLKLVS